MKGLQRRTKTLILAAGLGTRLRPLTNRIPKCLVPIHDRPLLDYWMEKLEETEVREVRLNTHHLRDQVADYIEQVNSKGRFQVEELFEETLLGSGGTVQTLSKWMDDADECLIIYADNFSSVDLKEFLEYHRSHEDPFSVALFRTPVPKACGIAELGPENRIIEFEEKPADPRTNLANAGLYVVSADAFREIAKMKAFDLGREVLPQFIGRMRGWEFDGYHRDIGTYESLELAHKETIKWHQQSTNLAPAVFLDRDGTIIRHVHHLADPADVELLPDAPKTISALQDQGFKCVVVTNQSVVERGLLTPEGLEEVHAEIAAQLAAFDVVLDGWYHCPIAPQESDPTVVEYFDRKPGPGMLFRAARDMGLDLSRSWMVGDAISDVCAGRRAGCQGSILLTDQPVSQLVTWNVDGVECVPSLLSAAHRIITSSARLEDKPTSLKK